MDCSVSLDPFLGVILIPCAAQLRIMKLPLCTIVALGFHVQKSELHCIFREFYLCWINQNHPLHSPTLYTLLCRIREVPVPGLSQSIHVYAETQWKTLLMGGT